MHNIDVDFLSQKGVSELDVLATLVGSDFMKSQKESRVVFIITFLPLALLRSRVYSYIVVNFVYFVRCILIKGVFHPGLSFYLSFLSLDLNVSRHGSRSTWFFEKEEEEDDLGPYTSPSFRR